MPRKLKVWGGDSFVNGNKQVRTIVATTTKKEAMAILGVSVNEFTNHWCETGNDIETAIALSAPGTVFKASSFMGKDFAAV